MLSFRPFHFRALDAQRLRQTHPALLGALGDDDPGIRAAARSVLLEPVAGIDRAVEGLLGTPSLTEVAVYLSVLILPPSPSLAAKAQRGLRRIARSASNPALRAEVRSLLAEGPDPIRVSQAARSLYGRSRP